MLRSMELLLDLGQANVRHSLVSVKNTGNFLKRWAFSLDVNEVDKNKLDRVPKLYVAGLICQPLLRKIFDFERGDVVPVVGEPRQPNFL